MVHFTKAERNDYYEEGAPAPTPGTWWRPKNDAIEWLIALCCCPRCGVVSSFSSEVHRVAADGTASPSYVCPQKMPDGTKCEFHDFVVLDGWAS